MSLIVRHPGLHSLIVDQGRRGLRSLGVPLGGAADRSALALGNGLVGNSPDTPAVEFTLTGPTIEALHPTAAVVFGVDVPLAVEGRQMRSGTTFTLETGQVLRVGSCPSGCRGYLCVAGGFEVPVLMGSRSGLAPLAAGVELLCRPSRCEPRGIGFTSLQPLSQLTVLRTLSGPQRDWFPGEHLYTRTYTVAAASDRMGIRLRGEPIPGRVRELVSEAAAPGSVQVTHDGLPLILGVEGQTIGGYPKIAQIIRADRDVIGQLRPGDQVQFQFISYEEADSIWLQRDAVLKLWLFRFRAADRSPDLG